uniref:allophycocyanin gamma subunit n=1 Tax=Galdieria phlegrea TaxID=1389228 RepID=UPI0023D7FFC7|nr:allophycocyanin gamma subunit [Galdieria phlegrea]WDA99805.1 allophycocyanin gamma subunit [Galdieria phlegrea]|eukprot:jgi/Galph1/4574/GphlegSOOS_G3295.1
MSLINQIINAADEDLRYPTVDELSTLVEFFNSINIRISIINKLKAQERDIIQNASKKLFQLHPEYVAPGGNSSGAKQRALCLRDYSWYLRLITYAVLAGDKDPIEKIGIIGVKEMYNSLGVPIVGMNDAIKCLKESSIKIFETETEKNVIIPYFDYLSNAILN